MSSWFKELRELKKIKLCDIAKNANITKQYVYAIESGKRRPSPETAKKLADFLGFDWTLFYEDEEKHD